MGTVAAIATVVGAVAGIENARRQRKAAKRERRATEKAARLQNKQEALKRRREIRQKLAAARVQRAQVVAAGFERGASTSSIVSGATGSLTTDTASNIGAANIQGSLEASRIGALGQAASARSDANIAQATFGGIQQTAGLFTDAGSNRAFANVFGF